MPKSDGPRFAGGQKVLYCEICSVPPEYCQYMDTPAECDEWLAATHPEFHAALQERNQKVKDERAAQIAALEAEKQEAEMEAAMAAEAGMDDDEAAMLAAMEAEMGEGGGETATANGGEKKDGTATEGGEEPAKEKKKKRKTRRGGANNRRQTGKSGGVAVSCWSFVCMFA